MKSLLHALDQVVVTLIKTAFDDRPHQDADPSIRVITGYTLNADGSRRRITFRV